MTTMPISLAALLILIAQDAKPGPRGAVGPDVPWSAGEKKLFARRIVAEKRTSDAVQAACARAVRDGVRIVFLPAGEYVFEKEVSVPEGVIVLGEGSKTIVRTAAKTSKLFGAGGDGVRFTRLKLQGADTSTSEGNDTRGISAEKKNVRIDHCELTGFSFASNFAAEATAQVDHCSIHHNMRDGLGYGIAVYSGAYVLAIDNEFSQNRHSLASNGALDWGSGEREGTFRHKTGVRMTHWELVHNRFDGDNLTTYQLAAVDTHPGMDGSFVVERNVFENLCRPIGIRDGSGLIRGNLFLNLRGDKGRRVIAISIAWGKHNGIPVEGCMPHDITVEQNFFPDAATAKFERYLVEKAENVMIDGGIVPATKVNRPAPKLIRLKEMGEDGVLRWSP